MAKDNEPGHSADRNRAYAQLIPQIKALVQAEPDAVANMANVAAVIKEAFGFHWVGFYLVKGEELVLGPFQGPVACTRIAKGKGVCGTAWQEERTLVVDDVEEFPGHIACSALSRSEIVVPMLEPKGKVVGVLDIDSLHLADLGPVDEEHLGTIVALLMEKQQHAHIAL